MSPLLSVIVATYNRARLLKETLLDLSKQETCGRFEFEVIVVDNNSSDETKTTVESFTSDFNGNLKYFFESQQGKPHALNRGIKECRGKIIAFTDDDVRIDKNWLSNIAECFAAFNCDGVGGRVLPVYPQETPQWIKENAVKMAGVVVIYDCGEDVRRCDQSMERFIGANFAFKKEVFEECGLFRTNLDLGETAIGEDAELINRLVKRKKILYYCGKALVWHPVDLKRFHMRHIARWHIALGRCAALNESQEQGKKLTCFWGVPNYLFKAVAHDFLFLVLNLFNRLMFWQYFRSFFRAIGMIAEYRTIAEKAK